MEEFNAARFLMSLRIRAAFEQAKRHAGGNADKVTELLLTKLERDEVLLLLIARESLKDLRRAAIKEGLLRMLILDHPRLPSRPPVQ